MISNAQIVNRIRTIAQKLSIQSDSEICRRCGFEGRSQIRNILIAKTAPQLDTLGKFARGLGVQIEDLIYDRTDADMEMSRLWAGLSEYEKMEAIVYVKMNQREKNTKNNKAA